MNTPDSHTLTSVLWACLNLHTLADTLESEFPVHCRGGWSRDLFWLAYRLQTDPSERLARMARNAVYPVRTLAGENGHGALLAQCDAALEHLTSAVNALEES